MSSLTRREFLESLRPIWLTRRMILASLRLLGMVMVLFLASSVIFAMGTRNLLLFVGCTMAVLLLNALGRALGGRVRTFVGSATPQFQAFAAQLRTLLLSAFMMTLGACLCRRWQQSRIDWIDAAVVGGIVLLHLFTGDCAARRGRD